MVDGSWGECPWGSLQRWQGGWMTTCLAVLCLQSKRRFERDCKEADRAQQYFEKMDADINVTKADVEKVRGLSLTSLERAS